MHLRKGEKPEMEYETKDGLVFGIFSLNILFKNDKYAKSGVNYVLQDDDDSRHTHIHIYTLTHIYIHTHTYIHTYTPLIMFIYLFLK